MEGLAEGTIDATVGEAVFNTGRAENATVGFKDGNFDDSKVAGLDV